MQLDRN